VEQFSKHLTHPASLLFRSSYRAY